MRKFVVHLSREYIVEIAAENENAAMEFAELYVSGGNDDSHIDTRLKNHFLIEKIKMITNDTLIMKEDVTEN